MSGVKGRLTNSKNVSNKKIIGFNNSTSKIDLVGINDDGVKEYYVSAMPNDLVLLSAYQYSIGGAVILLEDGGAVLRMSKHEIDDFKELIKKYKVFKRLTVSNNTYEVINTVQEIDHSGESDMGFSATASRYFNTKVNVSSVEERILTMFIMGFSYGDLYKLTSSNSLGGLHPAITKTSLHKFMTKYGATPALITMSHPKKIDNPAGLKDKVPDPTKVGELEIDVFEYDYNTDKVDKQKRVKKLSTFGGAIAVALCVDKFSGYACGKLLTSTANSIDYVKLLIESVRQYNHTVTHVACDSGVMSQSTFQVMSPIVERYFQEEHIIPRLSEPDNHKNGTPLVESSILIIKQLMRMAFMYIFRNPNFNLLGFTELQVKKLWGEIFCWALVVFNLKPCPSNPSKTRYEVFTGIKPNIQSIRLLPIFSVILVYREDKMTHTSEYLIAIYVGPSPKTNGCIRAAINRGSNVYIVTTTNYTAATDGGGLDIHRHVVQGTKQLIEEFAKADINKLNVLYEEEKADNEPNVMQEAVDDALLSPANQTVLNEEPKNSAPSVELNDDDQDHNQNVPKLEIEVDIQDTVDPVPIYPSHQMRETVHSNAHKYGTRSRSKHQSSFFADWSNHSDEDYYFSFQTMCFYVVSPKKSYDDTICEIGYRVVTEGIPKNYMDALKHSRWGNPARKEWQTLLESKALIKVDKSVALDAIRNQGADLVILFPVYEQKIKDGQEVDKVRLVADGRAHHGAVSTYASTPSREELLILLHVIASLGWDYAHIDEVRAFLNAPYNNPTPAFTKLKGDDSWYQIIGALYGLRTSPKDYQDAVEARLTSIGFRRLMLCSCIYICTNESDMLIIYDFVDDFIITGNNKSNIIEKIAELRAIVTTTEPIWNAEKVLGLELERDWEKGIIKVSLSEKIIETVTKFNVSKKLRNMPMPTSGYLIKDYEFEALNDADKQFLEQKGISKYMSIIGNLIWISGIRLDILFVVMYLSWFMQSPRNHHMKMAYYCMEYLNHTVNLPLVLGGKYTTSIISYTDASLGTGPKGRSIIGSIHKLNEKAGAISASATATTNVYLSSFESELDGLTNTFKGSQRVKHRLDELQLAFEKLRNIYTDNEALIKFVTGNGLSKGVRHIELRMWYTRELFQQGDINLQHMPGTQIPTNLLTKLGTASQHREFVVDIMGLQLLDD